MRAFPYWDQDVSPVRRGVLLPFLALAHSLVLLSVPGVAVIAIGMWWNLNTISHNFIHHRFFKIYGLNAIFSVYLSLVTSVPQTLWRHRHWCHHAGRALPFQNPALFVSECISIGALWAYLALFHQEFFRWQYVPAVGLGLLFCFLQGYFEHWKGTVSHYGSLYNFFFLNDGFHVEHHLAPSLHWQQLPQHQRATTTTSRWPPLIRFFDLLSLDSLERLVFHSAWVKKFVLRRHEIAFRKVLPDLPRGAAVAVVGGALFPRTVIVLQRCRSDLKISVIDASAENIKLAKSIVGESVEFIEGWFDREKHRHYDLLVFPLAFRGSKKSLYQDVHANYGILIHDWMWNKVGKSALVSVLLLKRLNLVTP